MATINKDNSIEFSKEDLLGAWENAPELINREPEQVRMCYICKFHMFYDRFDNNTIGEFGWSIDVINAKKVDLSPNNFIAVHAFCVEYKKKADNTKLLKKIKNLSWMFDEKAFENKE